MHRRVLFLALGFGFLALVGMTSMASASIINDIPQGINHSLFDDESLLGAQLILSSGVLLSAGLTLGLAKLNQTSTFIILLVISFGLAALAWLPYWVVIFESVLIAAMFASRIRETYEGRQA